MSIGAAVCIGGAALNLGWAAYLIMSHSPVAFMAYLISIPVGVFCLASAWIVR
jgi:hypothetical protein